MTFIFDNNFDAGPGAGQQKPDCARTLTFTEQELREAERTARAEGFEAGRRHGRSEALAEAEAARTAERHEAVLALAARVDTLCAEAAKHRAALEGQMLDFAVATCERLMPELLRTRSTDRAVAEVRRCLARASGSPRIRIYLSSAALELHGPAIEEAARDRHEGVELVLAADPALADGDARVEWENGVMEYSFGQIAEQVLDALRRTRPLPAEEIDYGRLAHG
ncbi:hypothetical protein [Roseicyclus sp.]|uniref:FliH/SctL family protein n=1 Tax=Roseicyclus sp. TaxID=1914329 RepID=UPI003F9F1B8F